MNTKVDAALLKEAKKLTGITSNEEVVRRSLELLLQVEARKGILQYFGSGIWQGDLKESRRNRSF